MNKLLLLLTFTGSINFTSAQWQQTNGPFGHGSITCIAVSGINTFAGTSVGGVFLSTDTGTSWTAVNNGLTDTNITSLAVSGANIFAGTPNSGVYLSADTGANWTAVNNGLTSTAIYSLAVSGTNIFAGTYDRGVFLTTNTTASSWTAVNNSLTDTNITSLAVSGTNIFAGTDIAGVWRRQIFEILSCTPIIMSASSATSFPCGGGSVTLSVDTNGGFFGCLWSNGETTQSIVVTTPGSYSCNISTNCGTITSNIISVTINETISQSGAITWCQGDSVTLTASNGSGYLWSDGETTQSIVVTTAGNYFYNIITNCGYFISNIVSVTVNAPPVVIITASRATFFCSGDSVTLTVANASSYLWSNGATTSSITASTTQIDSVTITDANGCMATSSSIAIVVIPGITSQPQNQNVNSGSNTQFSVNIVAIDSITFQWQVNVGLGFNNLIINAWPYSGVNTDTLTVSNVNPAQNNYLFRCIVSDIHADCIDTSTAAVLKVLTTGIHENTLASSFSIYPNPVGNQLTVVIAIPIYREKQSLALDIYNVVGEKVYSKLQTSNFKLQTVIDVSTLPAGMYFLQLKTENSIDAKRFIKE